LAVPAVATVSTGRLFRSGALVKSDTALERLAQVDTVVFDKTGTLSTAALRVPELATAELRVLKALAQASQHPLSRGLAACMDGVEPAMLDQIREVTGRGVEARYRGHEVRLGAADWIGAGRGTAFDMDGRITSLERHEVALPSAAAAIQELLDDGYAVEILSGDTPARARHFGEQMNVQDVHAAMTPEAKLQHIQDLQAAGARVVMIGDGLNDTLALSEAWASMAPGSALEASQNAADLVLLGGDLTMVPHALRQAKSARRRILENFGMAAGYNMISIPIAVAGFATPFLAALAMSTSSVVVTLNALRGPKRKVKP
ncbi:MAG: HAD-IC family P-type ATPase, partial [Pseudomonadota bacterium]